jgi:hypothetical protein
VVRQASAGGAHPAFELGDQRRDGLAARGQAGGDFGAFERTFGVEDRVDAPDGLQDQREERRRGLPAAGGGGDVDHFVELPARMGPAERRHHRCGILVLLVEPAEARAGVGLEKAGPVLQMRLGALSSSIGRVAEQGCGRGGAAEGPVVADVGQQPPGPGAALRQDGHGGVVSVQVFSQQHVTRDPRVQRRERGGSRADLVGERRQAERHALAGEAFGLTVERLVLPARHCS